jgi:RNA polymerase sigma factor (sigma-70 family)
MTQVDQGLFEQAARGDRESFWQLVLPYRGLIYSVAFGMLRNHERAEDLLHDVLLIAFGSLASLRDPSKLPGWLYSITRNRIMDQARGEERLRGALHEQARGAAAVVPVGELQEREAWLGRMGTAIERLPEPFRVILALKYMNDYSCREIAEVLDLTVPAVKSRLFEARKLLRTFTESIAAKEERAQS